MIQTTFVYSTKTFVYSYDFPMPGMYHHAGVSLLEAARAASLSRNEEGSIFVAVRFSQLYQNRFQDLLSVTLEQKEPTEMQIREGQDGRMQIKAPAYKCEKSGLWRQPGLHQVPCRNIQELVTAVDQALSNRKVGTSKSFYFDVS